MTHQVFITLQKRRHSKPILIFFFFTHICFFLISNYCRRANVCLLLYGDAHACCVVVKSNHKSNSNYSLFLWRNPVNHLRGHLDANVSKQNERGYPPLWKATSAVIHNNYFKINQLSTGDSVLTMRLSFLLKSHQISHSVINELL